MRLVAESRTMAPVKKPTRQRRRHFIKEWREHRGLTQEQVAARLDISPTTWGRIENKKVPYNQDFLEEAAHALQCEPWDLLNVDPSKEGDVVDMLSLLRGSPDEAKRAAAAVLKSYKAG